MLRLGLLVLAAFYAANCLPIDNDLSESALLNRLRRSPEDCDHDHPHPPYWPPPPFFGPPGPPPFWHHHFDNSGSNEHYQQYQNKNQDNNPSGGFGKPPCDGCGGSGAISNSRSDTGDAISIAISRGGKSKT